MPRHNPLDELTIEQQAVLADLATQLQDGDAEPAVTRREAVQALSALGLGGIIGGAASKTLTDPAAASAQGTAGTQSAPLTKTWTHALESGDGASQIDVPDKLAPNSLAAQHLSVSDGSTGDEIGASPGSKYTVTREGDNYHVYDGREIVHTETGEHSFHNVVEWVASEAEDAGENFHLHAAEGVYSFGNSAQIRTNLGTGFKITGEGDTVFSCDPNSNFDATSGNLQLWTEWTTWGIIEGIRFDANGSGAGVAFNAEAGWTRMTVRDCQATGGYDGDACFRFRSGAGTDAEDTRVDVSAVRIFGNSEDVRGIYSTGGNHRITIRGCIIEGINWNGIAVYGPTENFTIAGNILTDNGHSPIACSPARRGAIVANVIEGPTTFDFEEEGGIELEYKHVSGETTHNVVVGFNSIENVDNGIFVIDRDDDAESVAPHHLNIAYNSITNCDTGVWISHSDPPVNVHHNIFGGNSTDIQIDSDGSDVSIAGDYDAGTASITDNGTRTRWNGWIGGGPLGGVDLSSTTGQFDGDLAIADGTSSAASAGDLARWDSGNSRWEVWNSDATQSPS